jgi:hypothetical protein
MGPLSVFPAISAPHTALMSEMPEMAEIAAIVAATGMSAADFAARYALWRRRAAAVLQRVPVRPGAGLPGHPR